MRVAMGRIKTTAGQWCAEFDRGDHEAMGVTAELFREAMEDFGRHAEKSQDKDPE